MLKVLSSIALVTASVFAPVAMKADTYSFTISTAAANNDPAFTFTASGTISGPVDPFNSSAFDITSITGSANGYNFLGVVDAGATNSHTTGSSSGFTFDNVLYTAPGVPHTDANGFLLNLNSPVGISLAHVFFSGVTASNPDGYEVDVLDPRDPGAVTPFAIDSFVITPNTSAVPEPGTLTLLGSGVIGITGLMRRRLFR